MEKGLLEARAVEPFASLLRSAGNRFAQAARFLALPCRLVLCRRLGLAVIRSVAELERYVTLTEL